MNLTGPNLMRRESCMREGKGVRGKPVPNWVFVVAAVLLTAGWLAAQAPDQTSTAKDAQKPSAPKGEKKSSIAGATRVNTDAALKDVAKREAKRAAPDQPRSAASSSETETRAKGPALEGVAPASEKSPEDSAGQDVVEFHPAKADAAESPSAEQESKHSKRPKNLHGEVYGDDAKHPSSQRAGGAVGASSKSGKTSVYVETEGDRGTPPR